MAGAYTAAEYVDMVLIYGECGQNATAAARMYMQRHPLRRQPTNMTITRTVHRFQESGSINRRHGPRRRRVTTDENAADVLAAFFANPHTSIRDVAFQSGLSRTSILRILHSGHLHPFRMHRHQGLEPQDPQNRLDFCNWLLLQEEINDRFLPNVIFTDEARFSRDGTVNTQNMHYWSDTNPFWLRADHHQRQWSVNVWCGLYGQQLIGPVFFQGTLTAARYTEMILKNVVEPFVDDLPLAVRRDIWYQHDGATPHYALLSRNWLNNEFNGQWIGRGGPTSWPARSPDLTPLDFYLWGHLKSVVYTVPPASLNELEARIRNACQAIPAATLALVNGHIARRAQYCIAAEGNVFEYGMP